MVWRKFVVLIGVGYLSILNAEPVIAQFSRKQTKKLTVDLFDESKVVKDKDVFDPDTLRFQYHAQKLSLPLDTSSNLKLYYTMYEWLGTPYRYGGSTKRGIDCSGFTAVIYKQVYDRELPRDSRSMYKMVKPITKSEMKEGDLVFFRIRKGQVSHVGVYLGENKFVHSSTSRGVIISDLREDYYRRYFYKAGRLQGLTETIETVRDE
jgi:murein DD-endopeptidase / murein LD-carboxypeptidase